MNIIEMLPDWAKAVLGFILFVVIVGWILFPVFVCLGLDRIRKVLIQIRDQSAPAPSPVAPKSNLIKTPPPAAPAKVLTRAEKDEAWCKAQLGG